MKTTKIKQYIRTNRDEIITFAFFAGAAVLAVVITNKVVEAERENAEALENYIREENREGKTVYQLADGRYISVRTEE